MINIRITNKLFILLTWLNISCSSKEAGFSYSYLESYDFSKFKYGTDNIFVNHRDNNKITYEINGNKLITEVITHEIGYYDFTKDVHIEGNEIKVSYKRVRKKNKGGVISGRIEITLFKFEIQVDPIKKYTLRFIYPKEYSRP